MIIRNVLDSGKYGQRTDNEKGTVYIAFDSNQIKSVDNKNPTEHRDVRYKRPITPEKTFKNSQNANGEFVTEVLIDLADPKSMWWTGGYNYAIFSINKNDATEFQQLYSEIYKRTKDMGEYDDAGNSSVNDSFTVQDAKGKEYIYHVSLDGYMHGVIHAKVDKKKYVTALQRATKGGNNGKSVANIKGRIRNTRSGMGKSSNGNGRNLPSNGNAGYGGMVVGQQHSLLAGNNGSKNTANQAIPGTTAGIKPKLPVGDGIHQRQEAKNALVQQRERHCGIRRTTPEIGGS